MKPGPADLWLWEAAQARDVPAWARAFDAKTGRVFAKPSRDARMASLTHQAINARAGIKLGSLALRNTLSLLELVRRNQGRALTSKRPDQFQDNPELRTLADYMRAHGFGSLNGRAYSFDETRYPHYRRFLRRMARAENRAHRS